MHYFYKRIQYLGARTFVVNIHVLCCLYIYCWGLCITYNNSCLQLFHDKLLSSINISIGNINISSRSISSLDFMFIIEWSLQNALQKRLVQTEQPLPRPLPADIQTVQLSTPVTQTHSYLFFSNWQLVIWINYKWPKRF